MSKNLAFDFGRDTTTLSDFIGYIDLTGLHQILPSLGASLYGL